MNTLNTYENKEKSLDICIEYYIDYLLKSKNIDEGTHFYLKEIFLSYKALKSEKKHMIDNNNMNMYKLNAISRCMNDCECIMESYNIISKSKKLMEPKKKKILLKLKPIVAFNTIK